MKEYKATAITTNGSLCPFLPWTQEQSKTLNTLNTGKMLLSQLGQYGAGQRAVINDTGPIREVWVSGCWIPYHFLAPLPLIRPWIDYCLCSPLTHHWLWEGLYFPLLQLEDKVSECQQALHRQPGYLKLESLERRCVCDINAHFFL